VPYPVADVCPTLLHLFGLPIGEDINGKVLLDIYENKPAAIQGILSWDPLCAATGKNRCTKPTFRT
jgi:hypothetical protein